MAFDFLRFFLAGSEVEEWGDRLEERERLDDRIEDCEAPPFPPLVTALTPPTALPPTAATVPREGEMAPGRLDRLRPLYVFAPSSGSAMVELWRGSVRRRNGCNFGVSASDCLVSPEVSVSESSGTNLRPHGRCSDTNNMEFQEC